MTAHAPSSRAPQRIHPLTPAVRRALLRAPLLGALLGAASLAACSGGGSGSGTGAPTGTAAATTAASASPAAPAEHRPRRAEGSAAALSADGKTVFIAGEDHEVVFLAPTAFEDLAKLRVVPMPGPPAQIVVASDLVLVTVRTLPTDDAKTARDPIHGPPPDPAMARLVASAKTRDLSLFIHAPDYEKFLADHPPRPASTPAAHGSAAASATAPAPSSSGTPLAPSASTLAPSASTLAPSASARPAPKPPPPQGWVRPENTPARPFDPVAVRKSQGGLLLVMKPDPERGLTELARIPLPPDAWGLAVSPDGTRAVVTSAWSAQVSVIDINERKVIATLPTSREPRGAAITADGKTAYVSHLMGSDLTRIDALDTAPKLSSVPLPPAPSRTYEKATLTATLGYSLTLSPDGKTLFAPRHAMGAEGHDSWWGAVTVDVLDLATGAATIPPHRSGSPAQAGHRDQVMEPLGWMAGPGRLPGVNLSMLNPRDVVYRKKTDTLLVAGEATDVLTEVDALAPDPALFGRSRYRLSMYDYQLDDAYLGGTPAGVALSEDEDTAYVWCRGTFDLVRVDLTSTDLTWLRVAEDPLPADAARGRRLFFDARSADLSGGLACAGCHPEGRDDGHVWREALLDAEHDDNDAVFLGLRSNMKRRSGGSLGFSPQEKNRYYPRQTPMIAGRVRSAGPYGWHAEAKNLVDRLVRGFRLHRAPWDSHTPGMTDLGPFLHKLDSLGDFVQSGLLPPPTVPHPLTEQEKRGKEIFESEEAQCSKCHVPETDFTDRTAYPIRGLPVLDDFDPERNQSFKTPSLLFIAGTAPYFHDGSQPTLAALLKNNGSRMGNTENLSPEDRAALVAYLETL
ncbi:MAG: hypothetical protein R3F14_38040 [Polyangiaceae bacterium]